MTLRKLVIFDCDGVLVDSEPMSNRLFCEMLNEIGLPVTLADMYEHFVGRSMPQCMERVAAMLGRPAPDDFVNRLQQRTEALLKAHVQPVPGIVGVLDGLNLPFCVASSGAHSKIRTSLGATGLLARFQDRIFSAQDVTHSKPAPDLFLHAAATLETPPARCVVIEDSCTGVIAGVAAGMHVFGFGAHTSSDGLRQAGAHEVFFAMDELLPMIERWSSS